MAYLGRANNCLDQLEVPQLTQLVTYKYRLFSLLYYNNNNNKKSRMRTTFAQPNLNYALAIALFLLYSCHK